MDSFKEFTGKNLDDAIGEACAYFDTTRERLEIDIVQDSKSGIFGLVGARKAVIRAKRVQLRTAVDDILGRSKKSNAQKADAKEAQKEQQNTEELQNKEEAKSAETLKESTPEEAQPTESEKKSKNVEKKQQERAPKPRAEKAKPQPKVAEIDASDAVEQENKDPKEQKEQNNGARKERHKPAQGKNQRKTQPAQPKSKAAAPAPMDDMGGFDDVEEVENVPRIPIEDLDQEKLKAVSLEAVNKLTRLVVGDVPMNMEVAEGRVHIHLDCDENSGLLIGREGQTLSALQYITSRIVSRAMQAGVRVQLDAGDYRTRQDEKLSDLALMLAEKVRNSGKPHSTRPLSSYHRRIVHVALQDATDLHTRSSGDGPLKRVIIQRKRPNS